MVGPLLRPVAKKNTLNCDRSTFCSILSVAPDLMPGDLAADAVSQFCESFE